MADKDFEKEYKEAVEMRKRLMKMNRGRKRLFTTRRANALLSNLKTDAHFCFRRN